MSNCSNASHAADRLAHPEKEKAHHSAYYLANREKVKASRRAYRRANPEKMKAYETASYSAHPEVVKAWQLANPKRVSVAARKHEAKRRVLDFVPLNQLFDGAEAHHVNKEYVVYVPRDLHRSISHNVFTGKNMEQINLLALGYLVQQLECAA